MRIDNLLEIEELLLNEKNCFILSSLKDESNNYLIPDYLAVEHFTKDKILENIKQQEEYIIPNIVAVNVLENFAELRMNLNRVLHNSDWTNESCLILLNALESEVELLERFSIHYNISMILIKEDGEVLAFEQGKLLDLNNPYIFKNVKNEEFAEIIIKLSEHFSSINGHYNSILNSLNFISKDKSKKEDLLLEEINNEEINNEESNNVSNCEEEIKNDLYEDFFEYGHVNDLKRCTVGVIKEGKFEVISEDNTTFLALYKNCIDYFFKNYDLLNTEFYDKYILKERNLKIKTHYVENVGYISCTNISKENILSRLESIVNSIEDIKMVIKK